MKLYLKDANIFYIIDVGTGCQVVPNGASYVGNAAKTFTGAQCLRWDSMGEESFLQHLGNKCRTINPSRWPWCVARETDDSKNTPMYCKIHDGAAYGEYYELGPAAIHLMT